MNSPKELVNLSTATGAEIRQACKDQACYDASNFASALAGEPGLSLENSGVKATVSLNKPGRTKAKKLADDLEAKATASA